MYRDAVEYKPDKTEYDITLESDVYGLRFYGFNEADGKDIVFNVIFTDDSIINALDFYDFYLRENLEFNSKFIFDFTNVTRDNLVNAYLYLTILEDSIVRLVGDKLNKTPNIGAVSFAEKYFVTIVIIPKESQSKSFEFKPYQTKHDYRGLIEEFHRYYQGLLFKEIGISEQEKLYTMISTDHNVIIYNSDLSYYQINIGKHIMGLQLYGFDERIRDEITFRFIFGDSCENINKGSHIQFSDLGLFKSKIIFEVPDSDSSRYASSLFISAIYKEIIGKDQGNCSVTIYSNNEIYVLHNTKVGITTTDHEDGPVVTNAIVSDSDNNRPKTIDCATQTDFKSSTLLVFIFVTVSVIILIAIYKRIEIKKKSNI